MIFDQFFALKITGFGSTAGASTSFDIDIRPSSSSIPDVSQTAEECAGGIITNRKFPSDADIPRTSIKHTPDSSNSIQEIDSTGLNETMACTICFSDKGPIVMLQVRHCRGILYNI
jgi:hypothetical protein